MKSIKSLLLAGLIGLSAVGVTYGETPTGIKWVKPMAIDAEERLVPQVVIDDRTYVGVRHLSEIIGKEVTYNSVEKTVYVTDGTKVVQGMSDDAPSEEKVAAVPTTVHLVYDGLSVAEAGVNVEGHLYVPLRAAERALPIDVEWDAAKRHVVVKTFERPLMGTSRETIRYGAFHNERTIQANAYKAQYGDAIMASVIDGEPFSVKLDAAVLEKFKMDLLVRDFLIGEGIDYTPISEAQYLRFLEDYAEDANMQTVLEGVALTRTFVDEVYRTQHYQRALETRIHEQLLPEMAALKADEIVEVEARHILCATFEEAEAAKRRIEKGEAFDTVADADSLDVNAKGGKLGRFGRGTMVPEFEEAAFELPINTVSAPVKTSFGYHIVEVTGRWTVETLEAEGETSRAAAYYDALYTMKRDAAVTAFIAQLSDSVEIQRWDK